MNSVLKLSFCASCGLYSRSPFNSNKNPDYICRCSGFVKEDILQMSNQETVAKKTIPIEKNKFICDNCGLFTNAKNASYLCKCKNFSIPKIEVEQNLIEVEAEKKQNKKTKKKKSKSKTKKKKTKSRTKV